MAKKKRGKEQQPKAVAFRYGVTPFISEGHLETQRKDNAARSERLGQSLTPEGKKWFTFNGGEIEGVYLARPEVVFHDSEFEPKTPDPIHNAIRKMR
jgi:hypothetical protein